MNNVYLVGMMGCGKSTVGRLLAKQTGLSLADLDKIIEKKENRSISDIFQEDGEEYFRGVESEVLRDVSNNSNHIVSCGGGVVLRDENIKIMKDTGKVIYLERTPENIIRTLRTKNRPLLKDGGQSFIRIFNARKPIYENSADIIITNNSIAKNAVAKIVKYFPGLCETE